jgi:hypothetical protein
VAKKVRTPPPRSRQQGPRRRDSGPPRRRPGRPYRPLGLDKRGLLAGIGAGVVVGAVILVFALTRNGHSQTSLSATQIKQLTAAGCVYHVYPSEGRSHVTSLSAKVKYKTFPPTSGAHYYTPAIWNSYTRPLVLVQEVHNLEHGGIIIQYGDKVPQATIQKLGAFYSSSPNAMLLAPLPKLGSKIALTAWQHLASCSGFDQKAFALFRDAFRGQGPERYPVSALTPGA